MNETLMAVYIGILCAAMVVLLAWFVIQLVLEFRRKNRGDDKNIVQLDGRYYRVVPLSGANEEVAATEAPAEEIAEPVQEEPAPVAESAEPTSAQEQAETAAEGTEFVAVDDSTVVLRRSENLTFEEAYPSLSQEQKRFAGDILAYAVSREEGLKDQVSGKYASVYIGKKPLIRLFIRKGVVNARLLVLNNDLAEYADASNINIKEKPIDLKVDSAEMVGAVKDLIDLTYRNIMEDRRRREEARRERRRQRRLQKKQEEAENAQEQ